ncbi:MAG: ornithine carbamoyltransferase, partial [Omnitrophica WOR_2 bacterium RBG_13_44_8]
IRTFEQAEIEEYANYSTIPIINALTDEYHPCQILADILTIIEHKSAIRGLKVAYLGDSNNVSNTIMIGMSKLGVRVFVGCPKGHDPNEEILMYSKKAAEQGEGSIVVTNDPREAARSADVLYTDVWVSMGQDASQKELEDFLPYQINRILLSCAKSDAIVMHCLPAHRGEEITDEVIEGRNSVVFDQAENRLHIQKAILNYLLS